MFTDPFLIYFGKMSCTFENFIKRDLLLFTPVAAGGMPLVYSHYSRYSQPDRRFAGLTNFA